MIKVYENNIVQKKIDDVIVVVNLRNRWDEDGYSLDKYNSTEVDVYIGGKRDNINRIGGTEFRHPENIGKELKGYIDDLGFVHISTRNNPSAKQGISVDYRYNPRYKEGDPEYLSKYKKYFE